MGVPNLMWPTRRPPAAVNLGLAYSAAGAAFWEKCFEKCKEHWSSQAIDWTTYRTNSHSTDNQLIVQNLAKASKLSVVVEPPAVGYAIPRWVEKRGGSSCASTIYGVRVPSEAEIHQHAFSVNCWTGFWSPEASKALLDWVLSLRRGWHSKSVARVAELAHQSNSAGRSSQSVAGAAETPKCIQPAASSAELAQLAQDARFLADIGRLLTDGCTELQRLGVCASAAHRMAAAALDFAGRVAPQRMLAGSSSHEHALHASAAVFMQAGVKMEWLEPRCSSRNHGAARQAEAGAALGAPILCHVLRGLHTFYGVETINSSHNTAFTADCAFLETFCT